jgi:hypothetical protein
VTNGCPQPDDPRLLDWWRGELPEADSDALEEHLFACARCRHAAEEIAAIESGVRELARRGGLGFVPSTSTLERMSRDGVRMRTYRLAPGDTVACTVSADDDVVVTRLVADLAGLDEVDVSMLGDGMDVHLTGVPVEPGRGEIALVHAGEAVRSLPRCVVRVRLAARDGGGTRVVAEYTLDHTPPAP